MIIIPILVNVLSGVSIICANKFLVFTKAEFRFGTFLTLIHFLVLTCGCLIFRHLGFFVKKPLPIRKVLPMCLIFAGAIVSSNLSLLTNSLMVYQCGKIFTTPTVLVMQMRNGYGTSTLTKLSLIPVCLGAFLSVFGEANLSAHGLLLAVLAMGFNSTYNLWMSTKQKEWGATPMQVLTYQAPISAFLLFLVFPFFDDMQKLMAYEPSFITFWSIAISCGLAFFCNFSLFFMASLTSPLTVNVMNYAKTILVLLIDLVMRPEIGAQLLVGSCITFIGLGIYSYAQYKEAVAARIAATAHPDDNLV